MRSGEDPRWPVYGFEAGWEGSCDISYYKINNMVIGMNKYV